jgi:cytochrome oxidase Cu insertion factor (SCO1/SenC/PrrC family)
VCAALLAVAGCGGDGAVSAAPADPPGFGTVLDADVPAAVLDAPLRDADGHPTSLAAWKGSTIVLSDAMTLCQESCPLVTASMVAAARELDRSGEGADVEFVSVTIDPRRDDDAHLRAYRAQFGRLPHWTVLTGSPGVLDELWDRLGVWRHESRLDPPYPVDWVTGRPLPTDISHTDELIFIDPEQRFRFEMDGAGNVQPSDVPRRIYRFMDDLGHRNATAPDPGAWTPQQVLDVLAWMRGGPS